MPTPTRDDNWFRTTGLATGVAAHGRVLDCSYCIPPVPFGCPPQIDWMSDQPVQFAFTAGTFEQDGMLLTGYSNGQTEIPPIGAIIGPSPSGGLDIADFSSADAAMSVFAAVSGTGQPPLWARPAHVSISGTAGSIGLQAPTYDAGYDLWVMSTPYSPDDPTPPLGLVDGQNYCVTITFDTPLLQPDPESDSPVVFGFVAVDLPDGAGIDSNEPDGGAPFPPGVTGADQLGAATYSYEGSEAGQIGAAFTGAADFDGGTATFYDAAGNIMGSGPITGTLTPIDSLTAGPITMPALVVGQTYYVRLAKP